MADPLNVYYIGADEGTIIKVAPCHTSEEIAKGVAEVKRFLLNAVPSAIMRAALPEIMDEIIKSYYEYYYKRFD